MSVIDFIRARLQRLEHAARVERVDQAGRVERGDHVGHVEYVDRADHVKYAEHAGHAEQPDDDGVQGEPNQPPATHFADRLSKLLPEWKSLAAVAASFLGIVYVTLNAGYVKFYEGLGIHPEEVGFDRVAILGRTASLVFIALFIALLAIMAVAAPQTRKARLRVLIGLEALAVGLANYGVVEHKTWALFLSIPPLLCLTYLLVTWTWGSAENPGTQRYKPFVKSIAKWAIGGAIFAGLIIIGWRLDDSIQHRINKVKQGKDVQPILFGSYPLFDISATRARGTWLDRSSTPPAAFSSPDLLFLGRDSSSASFVVRGRVIVVPMLKVAIEVPP